MTSKPIPNSGKLLSSLWLSWLLLGLVALAGCGKKYAHRQLSLDGPEAKAAQEMLAALRAASPAQRPAMQDGQLAPGLSADQAKIVRSSLDSLAAAGEMQLVRLDRYGDQIVQVIFEIRPGRQSGGAASPQRVALLMAKTANGYRWLGRP